MGGQGLIGGTLGTFGQAVPQPNYGQQPVGANLGASNTDIGFGQAAINPDLSKVSLGNEQPISSPFFAAPAYAPNPNYVAPTNNEQPISGLTLPYIPPSGNEQLITGNTMQPPRTEDYGSGPIPVGNFGGISSVANQTQNLPSPYTSTETPSDPYSAARMTSAGNLYGANAATAANRVNQYTPYGSLTYQQTGTDAYGNPTYSAIQGVSPELQGAFGNLIKGINQSTGQGFNPNLPSTGINPGESYSDAIMRRLQPTQERAQKALDAQLANQGIMPGSEAYNQAKTLQAQQQNDQLTSAIVGGMQTGLQANQQGYNQALTNYQLPLSQLAAFRSATAPSYVNPYQQATVSGPDLSTAYAQQQAAQIAQQNADTAKQAAMMGGLFSLGGTALSNPTSVGNIATGISDLYGNVKNWWNGLNF
jgi:hypothetical protein